LSLESVSDERYIPITVHYSFSKLPDVPMAPRLADDRVGYFLTAKKDFSRDDHEHFWVRYVERWRLEKKDPTAALSEPVKPIVFYIDRTVPERYRPYVKEGVERWQKAFEAAGFKNAILAQDPPDDREWDPEDTRYSTIRWITSHRPSFSAIGPSRVDPRSGEILDADILIEGAMMQNYRNTWRRSIGPDAIERAVLPWLDVPSELALIDRGRLCQAQSGLSDGMGLLHTGLLVDGQLTPGNPVPEEFIRGLLVITVLHEVGHTLGLRHNFRSSTATSFDKLHDTAWTEAHGVTSSVMDYEGINVALDREKGAKQGQYFGTCVGDYDVWAIRYGYAPSGAADVNADYAFAATIAGESLKPGHEFSTDEDTYPPDALDPRTAIWDLGDDPLEYARRHTAYIARLWKSPRLEERVLGPEGEFPTLRRAVDNLLFQYARSLGIAVKYVGGQHQSRAHHGQNGAQDPLQPIPAAEQRAALAFLAQRAFAANAYDLPQPLLNRLGPDRWSHWGVANPFAGPMRLDYELNSLIFATQSALLNGLTQPALLSRLREAETRIGEPYRMSEHFDRMTRMLWGEVGGAAPGALRTLAGPHTRRQVQRAYVDRLATFLVSPPPGLPDDARALARLQLARIDGRARQALAAAAKAPMADEVRAHLLESRARIRRALDAGRTADRRPGGASARETER
jgi:hypothetical protein